MTIHNDTIKGYKIFESDFTCRDYRFTGVGTTYTYADDPYSVKRDIGDKEVMIHRITASGWAYAWAKYIHDKEVMIAKFPEISINL